MKNSVLIESIQISDLVQCSSCRRSFASHRIETHENICKKYSGLVKKDSNGPSRGVNGKEAKKTAKEPEKPTEGGKPVIVTNSGLRHMELMKIIKKLKFAHKVSGKKSLPPRVIIEFYQKRQKT